MLVKESINPQNNPNFIGAWYLEDDSICDTLIDVWKKNPNKASGKMYTADGSDRWEDKDRKESVDLSLFLGSNTPELIDYVTQLQTIVDEYKKEFPCCNEYAPWTITDSINIQYYPPGGGFKAWHTERSFAAQPGGSRHLVFMTYLNDVEEGGGTEFYHQGIITPARKGLTIIWPADWTHTHRGVVAPNEEKYIVTGWFNFTK